MRIKANTAALILPVFFFIGIGITMLNGYWSTENSRQPVKFTKGELAGQNNPADIRGSYSLSDIEKNFQIPVETLAKAFGVNQFENPAALQLKSFEENYGEINGLEIGTDSMRLFVSRYLEVPYTAEKGTGIPLSAYNILENEGKLSQIEEDELINHIVDLDGIKPEKLSGSETFSTLEDTTVKGNTTFNDLLNLGLTREQIEEALGEKPMGNRTETVRDYAMELGIEFSVSKAALQKLLDQ